MIWFPLSIVEFLGFKCPAVDELTAMTNPRYAHPVRKKYGFSNFIGIVILFLNIYIF